MKKKFSTAHFIKNNLSFGYQLLAPMHYQQSKPNNLWIEAIVLHNYKHWKR
jgi:hypothetical protein